jgi:hypothetical protein
MSEIRMSAGYMKSHLSIFKLHVKGKLKVISMALGSSHMHNGAGEQVVRRHWPAVSYVKDN